MHKRVAIGRRARLAVVGLGRMGRLHAANLTGRVASAELVAVVDAVESSAREVGEAHGVRWSVSVEDVLGGAGLDGVVIAAPTGLHPELVELAASAGKHVFCEKPLGFEAGECARAIEATRRAEVELQVGFQRRFDSDWCALADALESGGLGPLTLFRVSHRNVAAPAQGPELGNLFVDVAIHDLDAARWLGGEVVQVFAWLAAPPHEAVGVILRFGSGALALIDVNRSVGYGFECAAELVGGRATARLGYGREQFEILRDGQASVSLPGDHAARHADAYLRELDYFGGLVAGRRTPRASGSDALAATELALAAARSAREGAPVEVADLVSAGDET